VSLNAFVLPKWAHTKTTINSMHVIHRREDISPLTSIATLV